MKVDVYYDPIRPATSVFINGVKVDRHNVYGFLYPVRRCVLQTWLPASGSWSGLERQLAELARGEQMELIFHGRLVDYEDICAELREEIAFCQDESIMGYYQKLLNQAEQDLRDIAQKKLNVSSEPLILQSGSDLFQKEFSEMECLLTEKEKSWLIIIDNEEAFELARRGESCCLLKESFLSDFSVIDRLSQLTGSMQRSRDMILCAVGDRKKKNELLAYTRQFPQLAVQFVCESDNEWREKMAVKYGEPFLLRQRFRRTTAAFEAAEQCWLGESKLSEQHKAMREAVRKGETLKVMQRNQLRYQLRWLQLQRPTFEELRRILYQERYEQDEVR